MKKKIQDYIKTWEGRCYSEGIPDEAPHELEIRNKVPSYRRICFAILRNDYSLQSLGFSKCKPLVYHELKKVELIEKGKIKITQLKLF
jgi:predicted phosphoadenosine phosphosulfate sulfurtransferase